MVKKTKWLFAIFVTLYLIQVFPFALLLDLDSDNYTYNIPGGIYTFLAFLSLSIVLAVINIVNAVKSLKNTSESSAKISFVTIMLFKFGLIPFFIIHFFLWIVVMGGTANPFLMLLWAVIPVAFVIYAYLVLLVTSSYAIVQIIKIYKNGAITKRKCAFHIVMQLLFFADVIDILFLSIKYRKAI